MNSHGLLSEATTGKQVLISCNKPLVGTRRSESPQGLDQPGTPVIDLLESCYILPQKQDVRSKLIAEIN